MKCRYCFSYIPLLGEEIFPTSRGVGGFSLGWTQVRPRENLNPSLHAQIWTTHGGPFQRI